MVLMCSNLVLGCLPKLRTTLFAPILYYSVLSLCIVPIICCSYHLLLLSTVCPYVRDKTYVCIDGLPSNLVQMLSLLRRCAVTLTRIHTSKVKFTQDI